MNSELSQYPKQLSTSSQPGAVIYEQKQGYYALRLPDPDAEPVGAIAVIRDSQGAIALFKGPIPVLLQRNGDRPLPVYGTAELAVVPTGEIFIRFRDGINAQDRSGELKTAGYVITQVLDFAPQGAWIRAISGETADSLKRLSHLQDIVGVENIEPQLLMERQLR